MFIEFDWSQPGRMFFTQNRMAKVQAAYSGLSVALAGFLGDKCIVSGVNVTNGNVSDGWISYNGNIYPFTGGTQAAHVDIAETTTNIPYNDGTQKPVLKERMLVMVAIATGTSFPFSELVRPVPYKNAWNKGNVKYHKCDAAWIAANFNPVTWEALPTSSEYGWKIDLDAGGRVIMGWHTEAAQPLNDDAWSVNANIIGKKFGEQLHVLTEAELAKHRHLTVNNQAIVGNGGLTVGNTMSRENNDGSNRQYRLDAGPGDANSSRSSETGGGQGHNNIQPVIVYLTLEKM